MRSVIFAAALTGGCALIYIYYRLKVNSRTRRSSGSISKKSTVDSSDKSICSPLREEKIMETVTEGIGRCINTSDSSELLRIQRQTVNDLVLTQPSYSENSFVVCGSGNDTTDLYYMKSDTNSLEVKSDDLEEIMQISAGLNNLEISSVIECTEKPHTEVNTSTGTNDFTSDILNIQNSTNSLLTTNTDSFIKCKTVNSNMHSHNTSTTSDVSLDTHTINPNFKEEIVSSLECKDVNDNTKTLIINVGHHENYIDHPEDNVELHSDKRIPVCSEVIKSDVSEEIISDTTQFADMAISRCYKEILSELSKETVSDTQLTENTSRCSETKETVNSTPQLTGTSNISKVSTIVDKENKTSEVNIPVKPKSRSRKKKERRAKKLKELEEKNAKDQQPEETKATDTKSAEMLGKQSNLPPSPTDLSEQISSKNVTTEKCSFLTHIESVGKEISENLEKETSSSPDQLCTSDLERENSLSPEQEHITSDCQSLISQASVDSGQGSLEVDHEALYSSLILPESSNSEQYVSHQFEVPQVLVGKLIGKKGAFLNKIKSATSANIVLIDHIDNNFKLCVLDGKKWQVSLALDMIRELFPIEHFPDLPLVQVGFIDQNPSPQHQQHMNRQNLQVDLPPGVVVEVQASAVITTGELWLQQPLHPTFSALQGLHQCLNINYGDGTSTPELPLPIPPNTVCVCQFRGQWCRCQVLDHDHANCTVSLLDIGGYVTLPVTLLRQIRVDYFSLPFQATQCLLYGIQPKNDNGWDEAGRAALQELVKNNIIYATIAAYSQDGLPLINLYQRQFNQYLFINERLVTSGHARWMTPRIEFQTA